MIAFRCVIPPLAKGKRSTKALRFDVEGATYLQAREAAVRQATRKLPAWIGEAAARSALCMHSFQPIHEGEAA